MDLLEEVSVRGRVRGRANPNPNPNNPHPHPHPPTLTLIQAQVEEDAPAVLLALPLMTRAVEYSPQYARREGGEPDGKEFNKLWPRSTLEAAIGNPRREEVRCLNLIAHLRLGLGLGVGSGLRLGLGLA